MTTYGEFKSFVNGFMLAMPDHISLDQLNAIVAMVPNVISSEIEISQRPQASSIGGYVKTLAPGVAAMLAASVAGQAVSQAASDSGAIPVAASQPVVEVQQEPEPANDAAEPPVVEMHPEQPSIPEPSPMPDEAVIAQSGAEFLESGWHNGPVQSLEALPEAADEPVSLSNAEGND